MVAFSHFPPFAHLFAFTHSPSHLWAPSLELDHFIRTPSVSFRSYGSHMVCLVVHLYRIHPVSFVQFMNPKQRFRRRWGDWWLYQAGIAHASCPFTTFITYRVSYSHTYRTCFVGLRVLLTVFNLLTPMTSLSNVFT